MGNIAWIRTKKHSRNVPYLETFQEVNERRFGSFFEVSHDPEWNEIVVAVPASALPGEPYTPRILFHEYSPCKIGGKHPTGGEYMNWAFAVFRNEVGAAVGGMLGDEGGDGEWKPAVGKYEFFEDWVDASAFNTETRNALMELYRPLVPEGLMKYAFRRSALQELAEDAAP